MSDYSEVVAAFESRILRSHSIRETQDDTHPHWGDYDNEITNLATELYRFKRNIPRLRELDALLGQARYELSATERMADLKAYVWAKTAGYSGVVGVVGLIVALALGLPGMAIVASLLVLALSAGSVAMKARTGRECAESVTELRAYVDVLTEQRVDLLPHELDDLIEKGWAA